MEELVGVEGMLLGSGLAEKGGWRVNEKWKTTGRLYTRKRFDGKGSWCSWNNILGEEKLESLFGELVTLV